jgi:hypothetical protein
LESEVTLSLVRIVVAAVVAEALGIATLFALVAVFGPGDLPSAQLFAERLGLWVGPVSGGLFCLAGGWWVGRRLSANQVANGLAVGVLAAAIDGALLWVGGTAFAPIFAVSNALRIGAGTAGGWIAAKTR